ncbi:hypothetical protein HJG54_29135 [Leptolyngbya sp. NK1-12]|uniref:Uncharacterized protein n=1 Tax=Leptolyngbya sp. NK1-12 TaxID=2547451 RepID=A0AA97ASF6_9CYAN|nr:hypothetical protein [Leptolyngbya sp. NK1-12]WNZ26988.1 hypothetical protein HJG54_29135 [Leptolyngbya sp. NK1-12]
MRFLKVLLITVLLFVNFWMAPSAWADPIAEKSPEYAELSQTLTQLLQAKNNPEQAGYSAAELQQKIAELQFQKYIMESSEDWGVCKNNTNKMIGVYAHKPVKPYTNSTNTLYYLAPGQETDEDWDCDGVYLPNDAKVAGLSLGGAGAVKIVDGSRLTIDTDPTGAIQFNLPLAGIFKAGEGTWTIPNLSQAEVDTQVANAPTD